MFAEIATGKIEAAEIFFLVAFFLALIGAVVFATVKSWAMTLTAAAVACLGLGFVLL